MTTAIAKLATNVGVSETEITDVVKGMIVSAKSQHGAVATNAELTVVAGICATYGLNPLIREAHAFISGGKLQVIIGIDGWIKIMNRQPDFNGVEFVDNFDGKDLISITTKIHVKGRDHPTCVTEYMDECKQQKSEAWKKYEKRMLRNKSLGQGVRIAFGISEVIDEDEKNRIVSNSPAEKDITPQPTIDFAAIDIAMAECGDLATLKSSCTEIRTKLQTNGSWASASAQIIALNVKHKDRINAYSTEVVNDKAEEAVNQESQTNPEAEEAIEGELISADEAMADADKAIDMAIKYMAEDDIGFGEDDKDEFGEKV